MKNRLSNLFLFSLHFFNSALVFIIINFSSGISYSYIFPLTMLFRHLSGLFFHCALLYRCPFCLFGSLFSNSSYQFSFRSLYASILYFFDNCFFLSGLFFHSALFFFYALFISGSLFSNSFYQSSFRSLYVSTLYFLDNTISIYPFPIIVRISKSQSYYISYFFPSYFSFRYFSFISFQCLCSNRLSMHLLTSFSFFFASSLFLFQSSLLFLTFHLLNSVSLYISSDFLFSFSREL